MRIILIGFPGSGKTTQAKKVAEFLGIPYIGTGNLVRSFLENDLVEYKEQVSKGFLLPDDIVFKIVSDKISEFDLNIGFVMEGYPRTLAQAELLDCFLKEKGFGLDMVINLTIGDDAVNERVLHRHQCKFCGNITDSSLMNLGNICPVCMKQDAYRADDTTESLKKRVEVFHNQSYPLLNYYSNKNILCDIDASNTINFVFDSIEDLLKKKSLIVS